MLSVVSYQCMLSLVGCRLYVVSCMLSVVSYQLYVVCCLLLVVGCMLSAVSYLLYVVVCCMLYVVCCMLSVVCCPLSIVCRLSTVHLLSTVRRLSVVCHGRKSELAKHTRVTYFYISGCLLIFLFLFFASIQCPLAWKNVFLCSTFNAMARRKTLGSLSTGR